MIKILKQTGEEFDLPVGFSFEASRYNPLFDNSGDQTLPITLPASPRNVANFNHVNRTDKNSKPEIDYDIVIIDDYIVKKCNLSLNSLDFSSGIPCTIYFNNGDFYSKIDGKKMASLNWPIYHSPHYGIDSDTQRRQWLINLIKPSMFGTASADLPFGCCPLATDTDYTFKTIKSHTNGSGIVVSESITKTRKFVLNALEGYLNIIQQNANYKIIPDRLEGEYARTWIVDEVDVPTDIGYGITPFLKLKYVIDKIFGDFGYSVDMSDFIESLSSIPIESSEVSVSYDNILLVNTVVDAIYGGKLELKQLVPDVLISDFIKEINKLCCGRFFINDITKTAKFRSFENVLNTAPTKYLKISEPVKMSIPDFKEVILTDGTESDSIDEKNTDVIEFKSHVSKEDVFTFTYKGYYYDAVMCVENAPSINAFTTEKIINKNNIVKINNKSNTDNTETTSSIHFIYYQPTLYYESNLPSHHFLLKNSYPAFCFEKRIETIRYSQYSNFKENSNIPISIKMNLGKDDFFNMVFDELYLLVGQSVIFESMKGIVKDDVVTVDAIVRTVRDYE